MPSEVSQIIRLIGVCFFALWFFLVLVQGVPEFSFANCCSAGINVTHDMELDALLKNSSSDECVAINQMEQIYKEVNIFTNLFF